MPEFDVGRVLVAESRKIWALGGSFSAHLDRPLQQLCQKEWDFVPQKPKRALMVGDENPFGQLRPPCQRPLRVTADGVDLPVRPCVSVSAHL